MPSDNENVVATQNAISTVSAPYHIHNGIDSPKLGTGSGLMSVSVYDPASVSQQVLGTTATQTISNKTTIASTIASSASSGTVFFNVSTGNVQNFTFSGSSSSDSVTFAVSGEVAGQIFVISITQNSGGSGTVSWFTTIRWVQGTAPILTTQGSQRDTFGFICTGTSTYDGFIIGQNI